MKIFFLLTLFLFNRIPGFSQNFFTLKSPIGSMNVSVNGIQYLIDSYGSKISTKYPESDILEFLEDGPNSNSPILCNFKPDSVYSVALACCGSLDVIPVWRLNNDSLTHWDFEIDFQKIQNQLLDRPYISIRTLNSPIDSIYAWHADAACETEHRLINTTPWQLGVPPKCFFWSNITTIVFFKTDNTMPAHEITMLEKYLSVYNIVSLTTISFRLFDNQHFVLIYDEKSNSVAVHYE